MINEMREILKVYNGMKYYIPISKEQYIYHYTSLNGLKGIIEHSHLWFSDRSYLNDKSEGVYILDLVINNIDTICGNYPDLKRHLVNECESLKSKPSKETYHSYILSCSTDDDNLCLWNYYSKGEKGFNLKFDIHELIDSMIEKPSTLDDNVLKPQYAKVIYDKKLQLDILGNIVETFSTVYQEYVSERDTIIYLLISKLLFHGCFFKMTSFGIENEFRIVFSTMIIKDMEHKGIPSEERIEVSNGFYKPYIVRNIKPFSITEIKLGPTSQSELVEPSLQRMLLSKGYPHVSITKSGIPLRY